jgi:pyridinium-3,5-bisthiocarboxylic acid mononucleotide nickel chelatase
MKALYFDCSAGISGDMTVGALLDLEKNEDYLREELKKLPLQNYQLKIYQAEKVGQMATKFDVITGHEHAHRNIKDIFSIIDDSTLGEDVKDLSKKIFMKLGEAEALVHGITIEEIHFHEVGAIDSIIDIVAASILIKKTGVEKFYCGRITDGTGKTKIAHGEVDIPVPATRQLLGDHPMKRININKEMATPTGAAILMTLCEYSESIPFKEIISGYGAGSRDLPFPNVLKISSGDFGKTQHKLLIETNIDDMSPEIFPHVIDQLMKKGALDATVAPCYMKKGRQGFLLSVMCTQIHKEDLIKAIFEETTTFGLRINTVERHELEREFSTVKTKYGDVRIKKGYLFGRMLSSKPEFEDCRKLALLHNIPIKRIYEEIASLRMDKI